MSQNIDLCIPPTPFKNSNFPYKLTLVYCNEHVFNPTMYKYLCGGGGGVLRGTYHPTLLFPAPIKQIYVPKPPIKFRPLFPPLGSTTSPTNCYPVRFHQIITIFARS